MIDLAIRGGNVVTPHGTGKWNIGVKEGKIAFVAQKMMPSKLPR